MSHLDTAYKLGALQAYNDFAAEAEKQALQATAPPNPVQAARRAIATTKGTAPQAGVTIPTRRAPAAATALGGKGPGGYQPGQAPIP
jgi:hypothetical protein